MDALALRSQVRNSRWSRGPVLDKDGRLVVIQLTERDIEILNLLARYRYLPADDIRAFVGGSVKNVAHRLNLLSRQPNLYINRPHQQRQIAGTNSRPLIYELDGRGITVLRERDSLEPPRSYHRNFAHELMVCRIMASLELGTRRTSAIRLIAWSEIMMSEKTPLATRTSPSPNSISVSIFVREQHRSIKVTADARPFGIERTNRDGTRSYFFFPGIEADCASEPIETADIDRSSIYKKLVAYRAIAEQGLHKSHFGFPNLFVPIITTSMPRMRSMMDLLSRLTDGRGSKMFLFKVFPSLASPEQSCAPSGQMLTEPWYRVGFDPLELTK
jgi:hypothetical protein